MLVGSDVVSLFPSLTAKNTAKAVRAQAEKSSIRWLNVDHRWLCMYIHQNRGLATDIAKVEKFLPIRKKGKRGPEPGMSSKECLRRYLLEDYDDGDSSSWIWPTAVPTEADTKLLMAIMLEIAIQFFFENFLYTFGGESFLQSSGGPIGARITMCIARLVMQEWWEKFNGKLKAADIDELLRAIYVDDGRMVIRKL